jgi:hypothetical protein
MEKKSPWYIGKSPLGAAYQHYSNAARGRRYWTKRPRN